MLDEAAILLARTRKLRTSATVDQRSELLERCADILSRVVRTLGPRRPYDEIMPELTARIRVLQIASDVSSR